MVFGPNNVGRSSILKALHYLHEILERGNINPDVTIEDGFTDLDGFTMLVNNHEIDQTVALKVTLDVLDEQVSKTCHSIPVGHSEALSLHSSQFST